jgi:signal transduction histidine kinase
MNPLRALSIRWRLAVLTAGLTFLVLCGFAVVIGQLTASRIRSDFNNEMAATVDDLRDRLVIDIQGGHPKIRTGLNTYAAAQHAVIRVLDRKSGAIIAQTEKAPNFGIGGVAVDRSDQVGDYRVETRAAVLTDAFRNRFDVWVQYGRRISDIEATVARVRLFLLLGVLAGTGLALAGGLAVSRRALAPIARLTATARDIGRTRDPSRAVPVPDTDDEVAELARTLREMLQALEASREEREAVLARQRQFVADASHELRTPLTSVLANLELLADVLDGERGEAARSALRSTQRMRRLVADLLLLARADAQREVPHEPTDVGRILVEAAGELGTIAEAHELELQAPGGLVVDGARDELHRVVLNLMENAVKHTPPGTHVRADVRGEGGDVVISVEDDGPGVPHDLRDNLFERFVRGEGDAGGSFGLGLSIVRAVAESHGGTVALEDGANGGARFVVRLPRIAVAAPTAPVAVA